MSVEIDPPRAGLQAYCVRPNSGRIEPGRTVDVQVLLQAMKDEPATDAKCKDKFLVQSVAVTPDMEHANVTSIFEKSPKSSVIERKIRVTWLAPDAALDESKGANESTTEQTSPVPAPDFSEKPKPESPQASEPASTFSNAKAAVSSALPSSDDLKAQLAEANAQIQRLKDRLADQGLRQRKTGGDAKAAPATMQQSHAQTESGVPVQMVAGLCLLSFLIAYFFF
ncbi:hypothetical protein N7450_007986 [Penicillium hetheringtonii]|uniref:MSP domain-containing protein n=1 Tax=Penicillium hetheringtonii TaxID=911720 RepID=A0AAD6DFG1_9EURO|nr:hypothetical protein N7450_007986 [Penicillium hetheringtonii]